MKDYEEQAHIGFNDGLILKNYDRGVIISKNKIRGNIAWGNWEWRKGRKADLSPSQLIC